MTSLKHAQIASALFKMDNLTPGTLVLTPFHFICQKSYQQHPAEGINPAETTVKSLTKKYLTMLHTTGEFWKILRTETWQELQKRAKWMRKGENLKIDDVVLLKIKNTKPGDWQLGRIIKVYEDGKSNVRKADVKTSTNRVSTYACNILIPILTENEDQKCEEKQRNNIAHRTRSISKISITQVLITWLAITSTINCYEQPFSSLQPGLHLIRDEKIQLKATDLLVTINTNLNIKEDANKLEEIWKYFTSLCETQENEFKESCMQHSLTIKQEID